jgi:hypothetical protein
VHREKRKEHAVEVAVEKNDGFGQSDSPAHLLSDQSCGFWKTEERSYLSTINKEMTKSYFVTIYIIRYTVSFRLFAQDIFSSEDAHMSALVRFDPVWEFLFRNL